MGVNGEEWEKRRIRKSIEKYEKCKMD